jgi:hypothetical protein
MPAVLADNAPNCTQVTFHSQAKTRQQCSEMCSRANFCQIAILPGPGRFQSMTAIGTPAILGQSLQETTTKTKEQRHE